MSGIEVAGLVLGALPLVLHSVDAYKDGLRRFNTLFNKRKHVEKLARALVLQQSTLEQLIMSVAVSSGCADILAPEVLEDNPARYLADRDVQDLMEHCLGHKNLSVLVGEMNLVGETVTKLARSISGLVPSAKGVTDDLMVVIDANKVKPDIVNDLSPRIKLLFGITDIKAMIQEIEDGNERLDRFLRPLLSNSKATGDGLFNAIQNGFSDRCHKNHGVRLYLDDRIDDARKILRQRKATDTDDEPLTFDVSFYAGNEESKTMFHNATVKVLDECNGDSYRHGGDPPANISNTTVTILVDAAPSQTSKLQATTMQNLCATMKNASGSISQLSLALMGNWTLATLSDNNLLPPTRLFARANQAQQISLSYILQTPSTTLPIKPRMQLSLRLACSLLQLQSTQWVTQDWSKSTIFFHKPPLSSKIQKLQAVDLERPFIIREFNIGDAQHAVDQYLGAKGTLLELGILLLEIWHGTALEARFEASSPPPIKYSERLVRALEWQEDEEMLGFYGQAVSYCLTGLHANGLAGSDLHWNNTKLWGTIYSNIVDPLSKLCKNI